MPLFLIGWFIFLSCAFGHTTPSIPQYSSNLGDDRISQRVSYLSHRGQVLCRPLVHSHSNVVILVTALDQNPKNFKAKCAPGGGETRPPTLDAHLWPEPLCDVAQASPPAGSPGVPPGVRCWQRDAAATRSRDGLRHIGRALWPGTLLPVRRAKVSAQSSGGHRGTRNLKSLCPPKLCAESCGSCRVKADAEETLTAPGITRPEITWQTPRNRAAAASSSADRAAAVR